MFLALAACNRIFSLLFSLPFYFFPCHFLCAKNKLSVSERLKQACCNGPRQEDPGIARIGSGLSSHKLLASAAMRRS